MNPSLLDLFTNIESEAGRFLWIMMLASFLFGFFIALLLRWARIRAIKKELKASKANAQNLKATASTLEQELQERNLELQEASREKVDLMDRVCVIEEKEQEHLSEVYQLNQQIESLQNTNKTHSASIEDLNNQLISLKTQNEQLQLNAAKKPAPASTETVGKDAYDGLQKRLASIEASLNKVSSENKQLRTDLQSLEKKSNAGSNVSAEKEPELKVVSEKTAVVGEKIIVDDHKKDDLTQIEGIGGFIAKKLNTIGVFTFEDIAQWDHNKITDVTTKIEYIPGRIQKDDWVGQAANLISTNTVDTAKEKDDLKKIEGIGPKIETVLNAANIHNWATLAATEPGQLKEILENAGGRFRMHSPYTWPLQARLAAAGRWEELNEYQEELKGGKEA